MPAFLKLTSSTLRHELIGHHSNLSKKMNSFCPHYLKSDVCVVSMFRRESTGLYMKPPESQNRFSFPEVSKTRIVLGQNFLRSEESSEATEGLE